jgi:hypothetical protein
MKVLFISSMAIVAPDPAESRKLFIDALGLPLKRHEGDDYYFSESIGGSKHFGVWPLSQAAEACFGTREWPADRPIPQACIEFEVGDLDSVAAAAEELQEKGYAMLHGARTEPWGQTVARLLRLKERSSASRMHLGCMRRNLVCRSPRRPGYCDRSTASHRRSLHHRGRMKTITRMKSHAGSGKNDQCPHALPN